MSNPPSKKRAYPARAAARAAMILVVAGAVALVGTALAPAANATPAAPALAAAGPCDAGSSPVVCENSKEGTDASVWDIDGAGDPTIQGFSTDISVNVGSTVNFKIDTDAPNYSIAIYRTGWYDGDGARKIADVTPLSQPQAAQPQCISDPATEIYDCGTWSISAKWNVPATAVSGVYVARLSRADTGGASHITFIVRNDASQSDVVFQTSDPTWHAYNTYGGSDFYQGADNGRAYKLSYNRPFATRGDNNGRDFYFANEYPLVRFLEKHGYDVSYISGVDTDRSGDSLLNHKVFLSVGHDEYWSAGQRQNIEAARDAGVNMQFLSGNEAYWHTRWEPSTDASATPYRTLVSYKDTWSGEKIDDSHPTWTGTWRDPRFASTANGGGLPENAVTGTAYKANDDDLAITVTKAQGKLRLWRGTGLSTMTGASQALAPHTIGYESNEDFDNGFRPSGLVRMSHTEGYTTQILQDYGRVVAPGITTHNITLYREPGGGLVFSAGTIQWTWGLDQNHDGNGAAADLRMQQAQVNLLADMGAQPQTLIAPLVAATASADATGPSVTVTSPTPGSAIPNGTAVTLTGTATDAAGIVAGVNVSTNNGETWHPASGTTSWTYNYVQHGRGSTPVLIRAVDDSGNFSATPATVNYTVGAPFSVFGAEVPADPDSGDTVGRQLGLTFTPTVNGYVSGVRFYKSAANTGKHTGSLWTVNGVRLATVEFSNESATGWQQATFTSAVAVQAGTKYVVSYFAPNGHYAASPYHWISRGSGAAPLTADGGFEAASAGTFATGDVFPEGDFNRTNYYVDAVFDTLDHTPLAVIKRWPVDGATTLPTSTAITADFTREVIASTVAYSVKRGSTTVAGTTTYNATERTASFQPSAALAPATVYTVTLSATTPAGATVTAGGTWSFTTAATAPAPGVCPCTLYPDSAEPGALHIADPNPVTLGVRFNPTQAGSITGIRFYKNDDNTGEHVATLWSNTGQVLATATFQGESTAGWQTVSLGTPVAVTAGTTYVATYRTTGGSYSATLGEYAGDVTRGPLRVAANGGTYSYANGFPTVNTSTSYLVDAVFQPSATPLTVGALTPVPGAVDVPRESKISAAFSGALSPGYSFAVTSGGSPIAGTTSLSADTTTITFTPTSVLPNGAQVQVTLSGVVSTQGAALPPQNWSFTTVNSETTTVTNYSLFGTEAPTVAASGENDAVELGVSFTPSTAGSVTAIRFYKGAGNNGTHVGRLWSSNGTELAEVNFGNETASGWQTAQLSSPVSLQAGQLYVVSYLAPNGNYSYTSSYFSSPKANGPLTAGTSNNGRFHYGAGGGFPTQSWGASNYFVDVVFAVPLSPGEPEPEPEPETPPPPATPTGTGLFGTETPNVASTSDTDPVEVGVRFTPSVNGTASSVRFYKGPGNGGKHVGHLWSSTGQLLGTATFAGENASGWQSAQLASPVALTAGTTYVVSYFVPQGRYSYTSGYFSSPKTTGPLTAPATENGRFAYGATGGFPNRSYGTPNYFVDVGFTPAP